MTPLPAALDPSRVRDALAATDAQIGAQRLSLGPGRASSLIELFDRLRPGDLELQFAFAAGLRRIARAQLEAFPQNLFWDLDCLAASLLAQAQRAAVPVAKLIELSGLVAALQSLFGGGSPIRFRYVHDFLYGYDWGKWAARDLGARRQVGPFDEIFLRYMWRRGHELLELIAHDDDKYPKLPDGMPRNPFVFSREPNDEARLLRALAASNELPVQSWLIEPPLNPDRPYYDLRAARAAELGLTKNRS